MSIDIVERARRVRLLLFDVDGVLTDGKILLHADGDGTRLDLAHRDLPPEEVPQHGVGWGHFLERLVVARELTTDGALSDCRTAWADAARRTPHGAPIELA